MHVSVHVSTLVDVFLTLTHTHTSWWGREEYFALAVPFDLNMQSE